MKTTTRISVIDLIESIAKEKPAIYSKLELEIAYGKAICKLGESFNIVYILNKARALSQHLNEIILNTTGITNSKKVLIKFKHVWEQLLEYEKEEFEFYSLDEFSPLIDDSEQAIKDIVNSLRDEKTGREARIQGFLNALPEPLRYTSGSKHFANMQRHTLINNIPGNKSMFILPLKSEKITESGIVIPDTVDQETLIDKHSDTSNFYGMIVAAAPDAIWYGDTPYYPGDICIYAKHRETFVQFGPMKLVMIGCYDCWSVIPDNVYYDYQFDAKGDIYQNLRYKVVDVKKLEKENDAKSGK